MGLTSALGVGPVALDTSIFIYLIEEAPQWLPLVRSIFASATNGERVLVTSELTLLEVLVVPYRTGDLSLAERYEALLTRSRGLTMVNIERNQLRAAAQLRARYRLRTPDALQVAAALTARCSTFLTNDRRLPLIGGLRVVQLSDLS